MGRLSIFRTLKYGVRLSKTCSSCQKRKRSIGKTNLIKMYVLCSINVVALTHVK